MSDYISVGAYDCDNARYRLRERPVKYDAEGFVVWSGPGRPNKKAKKAIDDYNRKCVIAAAKAAKAEAEAIAVEQAASAAAQAATPAPGIMGFSLGKLALLAGAVVGGVFLYRRFRRSR